MNGRIVAAAHGAEQLQRAIGDTLRHLRHRDLDHRNVAPRRVMAVGVQPLGGVQHQQAAPD